MSYELNLQTRVLSNIIKYITKYSSYWNLQSILLNILLNIILNQFLKLSNLINLESIVRKIEGFGSLVLMKSKMLVVRIEI